MKFALAIETSIGVEDRINLIVDLSNELTDYFLNRDYGEDVKRIVIGIIAVAPEFEQFSKIRKPKHTLYRKYSRDDIEFVEDKVFSFDLKIDYESLKNQSDNENKKMFASEILSSLSNLDALPKKMKDFDRGQFTKDLEVFLLDWI